jgi:hypothetical protein
MTILIDGDILKGLKAKPKKIVKGLKHNVYHLGDQSETKNLVNGPKQ